MEHLIDKDALVAEIERRKKNLYPKVGQGMVITKILKDHYEDFLSFINTLEVIEIGVDLGYSKGDKSTQCVIDTKTLEVKEVELDFQRFSKEMEIVFSLPSSKTKNTEEEPLNWEYAIAKHFFDLGMSVSNKEQKEE